MTDAAYEIKIVLRDTNPLRGGSRLRLKPPKEGAARVEFNLRGRFFVKGAGYGDKKEFNAPPQARRRRRQV
ncbi:MAG: hypothetical protein DRP82_02760 [Planctomycetota bacterium]|nr:MAG: hypothetical protein DRP82_02760 [Planctomycetota bacterium]